MSLSRLTKRSSKDFVAGMGVGSLQRLDWGRRYGAAASTRERRSYLS
jgi:hypothetical protein